MRKTTPPGPYRPESTPHIWRTALIVGGCFLAILLVLAWMIGTDMRRTVIPQEELLRPYQGVTNGYDPGLYTPFTHAPKLVYVGGAP
jgi:hypothetical protein